jgi:tetratricopeptide (TPR) repeat protein
MGYGHLRLDASLPPYLLGDLPADETERLRSRWAEAMAQVAENLSQERFKDARLAAQLTLLELPNLLEMLAWSLGRQAEELVVALAEKVETLATNLGRPQALVRATRVREQAAQALGDWSHARFVAEDAAIERLTERGDLPAAYAASQELLAKGLAAGEAAYPEAAYDLAKTHLRLGRILRMRGSAEAALAPLAEAQRRFQESADVGDKDAERMAGVAITETGDCLRDLGRLEKAALAYEEGGRRARAMEDLRQMAVAQFQLGTVRLLQKRYPEALEIYAASREAFERLGEPRQVATSWHQIGLAHQVAGRYEEAEQASRQSLAIRVRENDLGGQASILNQLGRLYTNMDRLEEAVTFYRQATEAYVRLQDLAHEGKVRNNLASSLIRLRRYDEARRELRRAIECNEPYGHAAELWKPWAVLEDLERATGQAEAAQAARQRAIESYLAYRRAGGVSQSNQAQYFALVAQAVQEKAEEGAAQQLNDLLEPGDDPPHFAALIRQLQRILGGERNLALAEEPELDYMNAVELRLLLEGVGAWSHNQ